MTGADLITAAIAASGIVDPKNGQPSSRGFARRILGVNERTVRRWEEGERPLDATVARICMIIAYDPVLGPPLVAALEAAGHAIGAPDDPEAAPPHDRARAGR